MAERFLALLALLAVASGCLPAAGLAHGGQTLLIGDYGPYLITLDARNTTATDGSGRPAIDFTVYLEKLQDHLPEDRAKVELHIETPEGRFGPYPATRTANAYEVVLSEKKKDEWKTWNVAAKVRGPLGPATAIYHPPSTGGNGWAVPAAVAVMALATAAFVFRERRRRQPSAAGAGDR